MAERDFPRHIDFDQLPKRFDFPALFRERFATLEDGYSNFATPLAEIGIGKIKKETPATIYRTYSEDDEKTHYFLWVRSAFDRARVSGFIHSRVNQTFEWFLSKQGVSTEDKPYMGTAFVLQDEQDDLFLVMEGDNGIRLVQGDLRWSESDHVWDELCEKYGFKKVISVRERRVPVEVDGERYQRTEDFSEVLIDYIGKQREIANLVEIAQNHGMTNSQFLRFKLLTQAHVAVASHVNFEQIAREVTREG